MDNGTYYVPVEANDIMPMAEGSSTGGYQVTGYYVNWTIDGITGQDWSWAIKHSNSPFYTVDEEEILAAITNGNLNSYFSEWGRTHTDEEELQFLLDAVGHYGSNRDGGRGCIGEEIS